MVEPTPLMKEKMDRYCEKSLDTKEEFLDFNPKSFVREFRDETWFLPFSYDYRGRA